MGRCRDYRYTQGASIECGGLLADALLRNDEDRILVNRDLAIREIPEIAIDWPNSISPAKLQAPRPILTAIPELAKPSPSEWASLEYQQFTCSIH
jgi:hypothetical protein